MPVLASVFSETPFTSLTQAQAAVGQEIRIDDVAGGDLYHGRAIDGTATSTALWEIVRMYRDASTATIQRIRYVSGVAWDDRLSGVLWP